MIQKNVNTELTDSIPVVLKEAMIQRRHEWYMPDAVTDALKMAEQEDCSMSELACLIERDAKLATEVLSMSNGIMFAASPPVSSLFQAIARLGLRHCRNLILASYATQISRSITMEQEWIRDILWQHSYTTATTCMYLNRSFKLGFQGEEFTAGLLHDFGRMLFAAITGSEFSNIDPLDFIDDAEQLQRERDMLGTDHSTFGGWFATELNLPDSLVEAVRWHHDPACDQEHQLLTAVVAAADHMANHLQQTGEAIGYDADDNDGIRIIDELSGHNIKINFSEIAETILDDVVETTQFGGKAYAAPQSEEANK